MSALQPRTGFYAAGAMLFSLAVYSAATSSTAYNSEEHKWIVDRAMARVNTRSATLPAPSAFETFTLGRERYLNAKDLAVGYRDNDSLLYDSSKPEVQDNSYWGAGFAQRTGNFKFYIPDANIIPSRTLFVETWDGTTEAKLTFGELVALYGDYRRTVNCSAADPSRCYLTPSDSAGYRNGGGRAKGRIFFEYGTDCFIGYGCGYEPPDIPVRTYLAFIGSGLWPPFGPLGNATSNTAWPEEWHDAGWWGDEMMRIANVNDWHWSQAAVSWYIGMHRAALKYALMARTDPRYWVKALHHEASALHSLTDLFAFGHVVVSRDRTSWRWMGESGLHAHTTYAWMENVIISGGGSRSQSTGAVTAGSQLPALITWDGVRADTMSSYAGSTPLDGKREHDLHDSYNAAGGTVMNLKRQEFKIYGDYKMRSNQLATKEIIEEAVRASVQSLFDAYEANQQEAQVVGNGSPYFDALLNIPIYVKSGSASYTGMWTRYAIAVNQLTGAGFSPDTACIMPFVDGAHGAPAARTSACSVPPIPLNAAIIGQLLEQDGSLGKGDQQGLDADGNANGFYDVGDFLAWVRRTDATPAGGVR